MPDQTGLEQTGPEQTGPEQTEPDRTGPDQRRPDITGARGTTLTLALRGGCPRCYAPALFVGIIRFNDRCPACRLDISQFNVGDGPAAFLIMIVGAIVTGLAIALELSAQPPWWVHVIIWLPVTLALVIGLLRVAKAALLIIEYRRSAREGRLRP